MDFADMKPNELLAKIQKAYLEKLQDPIPPGFKSAQEWGREWNRSEVASTVACRRAVAMGMMKHIVLRRANKAGVRRMNFFAEVKR